MADDVRVRKDVWKLEHWDPALEWYAKAIAEMQRRPLADPTSWRYQAAIHDYLRALDPYASPDETLPSSTDQRTFWRQCQHNSWFFLPWHRLYLAYFEQIVAAAVVSLGGPEEWALPYWNYSDATNPDARRLPPAFRDAETPDGEPNPLRVDARDRGNDGEMVADEFDVDVETCLVEPFFVGQSAGGDPGFGGPRTAFNHSGGVVGQLELTPHGSMHVAVGGWMGRFNTAGLDPLFWMHHANIDRLWAVWRERDTAHVDPDEAAWLTSVSFQFHDSAGSVVTHTAFEVVDTTVPLLNYRYEDVSDPLAATPTAVAAAAGRPTMEERPIPEMVGATERPVTLTGQRATARLAVTAPTGPARVAARAAGGPPPRIYLNVENITGAGAPASYAVYLNLPPDADPAAHRDLLAGVLPMFGVAEASREDQDHPGSGLHYALEVGDVVRRLQERSDWDPANLRVTFVPRGQPARRAVGAVPATDAQEPVQVGRISLYFA